MTLPGGTGRTPTDWNYLAPAPWHLDVVAPRTSLRLFDPGTDIPRLTFTRIGDAGRRGLFRVRIAEGTGRPIFHLALPVDSTGWSPPDYAASLTVVDRVRAREETIAGATAVRLRVRGLGAAPGAARHPDGGRRDQLELGGDRGQRLERADAARSTRFAVARGVKLPQGFPGEWNYWVGPAEGRGGRGDRPKLEHLERLQLSLRREGGKRRTRGVRGGGRVGADWTSGPVSPRAEWWRCC